MTRSTRSTIPFALLALVAASPLCSAATLPLCPVSNGQTNSYDIIRGGNVIGHQTIHYTVTGPDMIVTVDVAAALHALGIRVFRYEHHGEEYWHDGQMVRLVTRTDDNGTPRKVDASRDPQTGLWRGVSGPPPGTAPLLSTSFWNSQTIQQTRLLDREKGDVVPIQVGPPAVQMLQLGSRQISANTYDLAGTVKGTLWYDANGCWLQARYHTLLDGSLIEVHLHP